VVEVSSPLGLGELEPEDKDGLEGKVPWEVVEDNSESKRLEIGQESKDDPVGEPDI